MLLLYHVECVQIGKLDFLRTQNWLKWTFILLEIVYNQDFEHSGALKTFVLEKLNLQI